ncbi:hypothetical protein DNTS_034419 [Danionella cerebrum]|uniref:Swi5-dependent recombination DNA repair protein 1 homolog n=1 Tax=Danionella cerebrum TaxID=2873325 RepID=A0A553MQE0_9TELE|nr:hypothetical protein DNTS_034419 [Danionella translucida]
MSKSLRQKLKRARPSFKSPVSVVKRLRIDEETQPQPSQQHNENNSLQGAEKSDKDANRNGVMDCSRLYAELDQKDTFQQCQVLKKVLKEKSETLRRLKMVKMYRTKNDLTQLQRLIDKWRSCAQSALHELKKELASEGKQASLSQLIDSFGIEDRLLQFDRKEEDFTNT